MGALRRRPRLTVRVGVCPHVRLTREEHSDLLPRNFAACRSRAGIGFTLERRCGPGGAGQEAGALRSAGPARHRGVVGRQSGYHPSTANPSWTARSVRQLRSTKRPSCPSRPLMPPCAVTCRWTRRHTNRCSTTCSCNCGLQRSGDTLIVKWTFAWCGTELALRAASSVA